MNVIEKLELANCVYDYRIDAVMPFLALALFGVFVFIFVTFRNNPFVIIPMTFFSPFIILGGAEFIGTLYFAIKNWEKLEHLACVEHPIVSFND